MPARRRASRRRRGPSTLAARLRLASAGRTLGAVTPEERSQRIRARALELGFEAVGFAPAEAADGEQRLRAWLDRGFGAGLSYIGDSYSDRADPRIMLPGARSVVALAVSYYRPDYQPGGPLKVSRYAVAADYHPLIRRRVRKLRRFMLALDAGARVHPTVDTSPVLERHWAERAGIAWIGKSTMAIGQRLGTYTFLATLVTTMELSYDRPHVDRCGSCTACLDACPTQAFAGPHQLDARRCITYWNVEHHQPWTADAVPLHGWLAGCDVCQEVCPWNKFARPTAEPRFAPRPGLARPDAELLSDPARDGELADLIKGTALERTGAKALRRNARALLALAPETD